MNKETQMTFTAFHLLKQIFKTDKIEFLYNNNNNDNNNNNNNNNERLLLNEAFLL